MATYDLKYPGAAIDAILDTAYDLQNAGYIFRGLASEYSNTPTERSWVLAGEGETGHGFTSPIPKGYIGVCVFDGTSWTGKLLKCVSIDSTPTNGSTNALSSGGAYASINNLATFINEALDNLTFTDTTPSAFLGNYIKMKVSTTDGGIERIMTYFTILAATAEKAGLLSAADKQKLDAMLGNLRSLKIDDTTAYADLGTKIVESIKATIGGTEETISTFQILAATASKAGLLSAADKAKLDAILGNLRSLEIDDTTAYADLGDKIVESIKATIGGTEETISTFQILAATASKAGLLSAADKAKLDALWSSGYQFAGIATPSTTPISTTSKIFYIATEAGTYFNSVTVTQGINIIYKSGDAWSVAQVVGIDNEPTAGSENVVESGGIFGELALGAVYDVSAKNPTAGPNSDGKWESLSALLSDANLNTLIPTSVRKGGMSIKYVQSSDNKYVRYFCNSQSFTTDTYYWYRTEDEIAEISENTKNLLDSNYIKSKSGISLSGNTISGTAGSFNTAFSENTLGIMPNYSFKENTRYVISGKIKTNASGATNNGLRVNIIYTDSSIQTENFKRDLNSFTPFYITSAANKTISKIALGYVNGGLDIWDISELQIEEGVNATIYIPHVSATDYGAREEIDEHNKTTEILYNEMLFDNSNVNPNWINGAYNDSTGQLTRGISYRVVSDMFKVNGGEKINITVPSNHHFKVCRWDSNRSFISTGSWYTSSQIVTIPSGTEFFAIMVTMISDQTDIDPATFTGKIGFVTSIDVLNSQLELMNSVNLFKKVQSSTSGGVKYVSGGDGYIVLDGSHTSDVYFDISALNDLAIEQGKDYWLNYGSESNTKSSIVIYMNTGSGLSLRYSGLVGINKIHIPTGTTAILVRLYVKANVTFNNTKYALTLSEAQSNKALEKASADFRFLCAFGTGDCTIIKFNDGKVLVIDFGLAEIQHTLHRSWKRAVTELGITHIDYAIISHYHGDHVGLLIDEDTTDADYVDITNYIDSNTTFFLPNGHPFTQEELDALAWVDEMSGDHIVSNYTKVMAFLNNQGCKIIYPSENEKWNIGGAEILFWNADQAYIMNQFIAHTMYDYNNASLCNYIRFGDYRICFSGDIGLPVMEHYEKTVLSSQIFKVNHHSVGYDVVPLFLNSLMPKLDITMLGTALANGRLPTNPNQTWCEENNVPNVVTGVNDKNISLRVSENGYNFTTACRKLICDEEWPTT